MAEAIEYEQFEPSAQNGAEPTAADLSRLSEIPMELSVEIGRTHMTVGETLDLRVGSVVALERLAGETADLLVNGSAIARGEVVVIDEQYGLRITEILDGQSDPASISGEGASPEGKQADRNGGGPQDADGEGPKSSAATEQRPQESEGASISASSEREMHEDAPMDASPTGDEG